MQSNALNYEGEVIQEIGGDENDVSERMVRSNRNNYGNSTQPINVNDIQINEVTGRAEGNVKLPLNNGISAMNTE